MDKFQLATLARWAGDAGLQGRKRLQKTIFLLQFAGCPLDADFVLHYYGPYSQEVADICDEMTTERLLTEEVDASTGVRQYNYRIPPQTAALLDRTNTAAPQRLNAIKAYEDLAKDLLIREVWPLELGSTILFFYSRLGNWDEAITQACEFKKVPKDNPVTNAALELAKRIASRARSA